MEAKKAFSVPLPTDMTRCLGYGIYYGDGCPKRMDCARFMTIQFDEDLNRKTAYRCCSSIHFHNFLPTQESVDADS